MSTPPVSRGSSTYGKYATAEVSVSEKVSYQHTHVAMTVAAFTTTSVCMTNLCSRARKCTSNTIAFSAISNSEPSVKLEDELWCPSVHVGAFNHLKRLLWPCPFDLQNLVRSLVGTGEYSLSVLSKLFKAFTRYRGNNTCLDEQTGQRDSQKT